MSEPVSLLEAMRMVDDGRVTSWNVVTIGRDGLTEAEREAIASTGFDVRPPPAIFEGKGEQCFRNMRACCCQ